MLQREPTVCEYTMDSMMMYWCVLDRWYGDVLQDMSHSMPAV